MKKLIIFISLLLLSSCGVQNSDSTIEKSSSPETLGVSGEEGKLQTENENNPKETQEIIEEEVIPAPNIKEFINTIPDTYLEDPELSNSLYDMISSEIQFLVQDRAVREKNPELCKDLPNDTQKSQCVNNYYFMSALETKDAALCEQASNSIKDNCIHTVTSLSATEQGDPTMCDTIPTEEEKNDCKDQTYLELATKEQDIAKCEQISDELYKEMCKENFELFE